MIIELVFRIGSGTDGLDFTSSTTSKPTITYFCGYPNVQYLADNIISAMSQIRRNAIAEIAGKKAKIEIQEFKIKYANRGK